MKGKLGAQLFTVRDFVRTIEGVAETFQKVAAIGYTGVQLSGFGPVDPHDVARLAEEHGLTIASTHIGWDRFLDDLDAVIAEHKLWKCTHLAIGGLFGPEYRGVEGIKRFVDELAPVAARLAQEGMDFSYHNHNHELAHFGGRTWLEQLYEQATPELLKVEIDTYWIQAGGGDPAAWIRRYPGRQPLLHLKDMVVTPEREQRMAEVGEGNLNWPAILQAAEEAGVEWYLVEQDDCYGRDPFESLAISYRNLRRLGISD